MQDILDTHIAYLKGVGPERASLLQKELNINTYGELLVHFPFRYVDRTSFHRIADLKENMPLCQIIGKIEKIEMIGTGRSKRLQAVFNDGTGKIELVWFQGLKWVAGVINSGVEYIVFGKPNIFKGKFNIVHPELEIVNKELNKDAKAKLEPVYNTTERLKTRSIDSKAIGKLQKNLLDIIGNQINENLPDSLLHTFRLMPRKEAFQQVHFPDSYDQQQHAVRRLKFEELFYIQLKLLQRKNFRKEVLKGYVFDKVGALFHSFYKEHLPFQLTDAQKRVIKEIREDVRSGRQMNRLLQGDVGSGKTIVALMSMLLALDNGKQACLMSPTEILSIQHYQNISHLLSEMDVKVRLLTGSTTQAERRKLKEELKNSEIDILIGTHALLEKWVDFDRLGIVVIDEQHRFGVAQRAKLWKKSKIPPHILIMTATPIPRTLSMTLYGDLDTSVIDELPPGRKEIETRHFFEEGRLKVIGFMKREIAAGRQIYVVFPLIEESESMDYANLMEGFEVLAKEFPAPKYQLGIMHGRMSAADKDFEMKRFKNKETHILVSTTVIEVGVDVPNATIMLIESAERFGLTQLHQLRGRVGRGGNKSYCLLMTSYRLSQDARTRIETMVRTNNGFEIAEADLLIRGPGDILGTQQSGMLDLKIANLAADQKILVAARVAAQEILKTDPKLVLSENAMVLHYMNSIHKGQPNWSMIS